MALDYLLSPLTEYTLLALGLGAASYLFLTLKKELRVLKLRCSRREQTLEEALQALVMRLEQTRGELKQAREERDQVPPAGPISGMNFTKRGQALRMLRRGEGSEHVAAALHLSQGEVDLLRKVHGILATNNERLTA